MVVTWPNFYYTASKLAVCLEYSVYTLCSFHRIRTTHVRAQGCHCFTWCNNTEFSEQVHHVHHVHLQMVSTHNPSRWWLAKGIYLKLHRISANHTLSQMNAETRTRATTLLFGEHESCTTHARSDTHSTCTSASIHLPNRKQT